MLFRLIAIVVLALGVTGFVLLLDRFVLKNRLPNWVLPTSIAAAILGFEIYQEYDWYPRNKAELGDDYVVVQESGTPQFYRPWNYIVPSVDRFSAVYIGDDVQILDEQEGGFIAPIVSYRYLASPSGAPFVFDCQNARFGPVASNFDAVEWADMSAFDEEFYAKVCDAVSFSE